MKRLAMVSFIGLLLSGCAGEERTPEGTARLLLRAIESGDSDESYRLLAPETQRKLGELASLATAQTGGRNRIKPRDLLISGMNQLPSDRPQEVQKARVTGETARVELVGDKGKTRQTLDLIRVDGRWRVVLPPDRLRPPAPASRPTSRPV